MTHPQRAHTRLYHIRTHDIFIEDPKFHTRKPRSTRLLLYAICIVCIQAKFPGPALDYAVRCCQESDLGLTLT
ncbi:hypothetical protein PLICRDRAFT_373405 [Plicaturopsis crispa FD-325 SS-3]|uniref:Uncharacterized protein n=1 Tax=Plicaturopsis crispa FD-325 SS-3 TaxID=944288 RepID=A0A0C9SKR2_PLICR|nr:hypothetical protein PLICRDRAFT_373405 [Plicaturopsis crispa FD-325 SS-3]